jgi:hypothetical protein
MIVCSAADDWLAGQHSGKLCRVGAIHLAAGFSLFPTSAISRSSQNRNHKAQKKIAIHEDY